MNEFRERILGRGTSAPLLRAKAPKDSPARAAAEEENLSALPIPRSAGRQVNHRGTDRHRLAEETVRLRHGESEQQVALVNLSGGGAMIEGASDLVLWDQVELELGGEHAVEAIVRWIKGPRTGLEFAHETRIAASRADVADTLRAVIQRSFPDVSLEVSEPEREIPPALAVAAVDSGPADREPRHPLIWSGIVHFNHDSLPVRLRNISSGGALIESSGAFPVGSDVLLDLGEAGSIFGTVHWAQGDQAGIRFHVPFDLKALAEARPEIAGPRWTAPPHLREDRSSNSPWSKQWDRADLGALHRALEATRASIRRR